jgi:hypothetical protein
MTTSSRRNGTAPAPDAAELAERVEQLEQTLTTTLRILSRWIVRSATGQGAATFSQILVGELHIATHEEAQAVEVWLTARQ